MQKMFAIVIAVVCVFAMFYSHHSATPVTEKYVIDQRLPAITYHASPLDHMPLSEVLSLLVLGFISGIVGGMLGMGGGLLKVTGMYLFFGYEVILARVITLITYACISMSAFIKYREFKFIIWDVVKILAVSAIFGVGAGVLIGNAINSVWLEKFLGAYALIVGAVIIFQAFHTKDKIKQGEWTYKPELANKISLIGVLKGFFCGLFGISGGIISVPLQQFLLKIPVKNAIANSLTSAMFSATFAAFLALTTGIASGFFKLSTVLILVAPLIPGTIIGARIGALFTRKMDTFYIKILFAVIAIFMGFKIVFFNG